MITNGRVMKDRRGIFDGTVKCHPACDGQTPCIAACKAHNKVGRIVCKKYVKNICFYTKAWNESEKGYRPIDAQSIIPFSEASNT